MGRNKDITERERYQIEGFVKARKSIKEIAVLLNRHYQTIYREIKRGTVEMVDTNLKPYKKYCADRGQQLADSNKHNKGRELKIGNDLESIQFMEKLILEKKYSPQAVLYCMKQCNCFKTEICVSTLYSYIDKGILLNVTNKNLPIKSQRKQRNMHKISSVSLNNTRARSIEERPKDVLNRDKAGCWEMDTVVGKQGGNKDCLLVLTERKSRYEYIFKIPDKTQKSVIAVLDRLETLYGFEKFKSRFHSITMDNGVEFLDMNSVERSLTSPGEKRTIAYYCHPYCPHERGSNENQNKLIRRHIPKGTDISPYSEDAIKEIETWINTYPRKLFNGRTSADILADE